MSLGNQSEENMKTLIDAVAQVTSRPLVPPFPYPQVVPLVRVQQFGAGSGIVQGPNQGGPLRKRNHDCTSGEVAASAKRGAKSVAPEDVDKREKRLGQNRIAAVESRRRKKLMIEELQRSVQYYSRANSSIKSQNTELERQLLLAKHQVLMNRSSNGQLEGHGDDIAPAADVSIRKDAAPIPAPKAPPQQVHSSESMSIIGHRGSLCVPSSTPAHVSKVAIDDQAQQAQFAATQALYTSMGYPAGAARFAASTLSQFVGQTGIPLVTSAPDDYVVSSERNPAPKAAQQIKPIQSISSENAKSPNVEPKEDSYIDALNRFAMQQAAAANAAAAAATAALQAAQLHLQYKEGGGSSSVSDAPKFPFSFPAGGMAWPFPSPAQFPKND